MAADETKSEPIALRARQFLDSKLPIFAACIFFALAMLNYRVLPLNALPYYDGSAGQDCYQMVWDLWQPVEAITRGHNPYYTDLIYHPIGAPLGRHSLAAGFFPLTLSVKLLSRGDPMYPFYAYRIAILLSFALILYFTFLTLRELEFDRWAAAIPAVAYAFSAFYMEHFFHLTQVAGFFIPLTAFFAVRWYRRPSAGKLITVAAVAAASFYFTEFAVYILMSAALLFSSMLFLAKERAAMLERMRTTGSATAIAAAIIYLTIAAPFLISFLTAHTLNPAPAESSFYSANLAGFLIPLPQDAPLYGNLFSRATSQFAGRMGEVFIGLPVLILTVVALIKTKRRLVWLPALISGLFLLLSLGPTLKILRADTHLPLPYSLLMWVPPFDSGRTPVRFVVIGMFFLMIVCAGGVAWLEGNLRARIGGRWTTLAMSLILIWIVAERYSPVARSQPFSPPPSLEKIVNGPVLNLPLIRNDGYAEALQIFHRQPIATGYLARYTPEQWQQFESLQRLFHKGGATFCEGITAIGIRNIVIAPRNIVPDAPSVAPLELSKCSINVVDLLGGADIDNERPDRFPPYRLGTRLAFTSPESDPFLWYGWSEPEREFRWSSGSHAAIVFAIDQPTRAVVRMTFGAFLIPGRLPHQNVNVALNGHVVTTLRIVAAEASDYSFDLPAEFLRKENVLSFDLPDAESPSALHLSEDNRLLAINAQWIEIDVAK
jgi:hypothetical protein